MSDLISDIRDIPKIGEVLSGSDSYALGEEYRSSLLVCSSATNDAVYIFTAPGQKSGTKALALRDRIADTGKIVKIIKVDAGLIALIREQSEEEYVSEADLSDYQKTIDKLLADAIEHSCSDMHIEVRDNGAKVKMRIHGVLVTVKWWSKRYAIELSRVLYGVTADETGVMFDPSIPQAGIIDKTLPTKGSIRIRLNTLPAYPTGFDICLRFLSIGVDDTVLPLKELGYSAQQIQLIQVGLASPVGVLVLAGTTGSGKSTSLRSMLTSRLDKANGSIRCITVEDPPEYLIPGATQVPVNREVSKDASEAFAQVFRACLRADPDLLMVGEVRDQQSAHLLEHAIQSGHQVLTTVHASSAFGIIQRLESIGIKRDVLASSDFLSGLIYQCLVPKLCPHCSKDLKTASEEGLVTPGWLGNLAKFVEDIEASNVRFRGEGCEYCNSGVPGYVGRTVLAEVVVPDPQMLAFIREGRLHEAAMHWIDRGGKTIRHHGREKVIKGVISPVDLEMKLGPMNSDAVMKDGQLEIATELSMLVAAEH